jgi:GrpB-like predicted nucleotidyltransferase (UPF0157 family)
VGSTAVAGLAAKPVIDLDIVISCRDELCKAVMALGRLGYEHQGNLGIEDRDAFRTPPDGLAHNLYVCPRESLALRDHIRLRDHLRTHPPDVAAYSALKKQLAEKFPHDMESYVEGKSAFILSILAQYGLSTDRLDSIQRESKLAL